MITLPGLIDVHVHLRTPGQTHKEDFLTGTSAALAGGFTTVLDMPNNKIPITTEALLNEKIKLASEQALCDIGFHFGSVGSNQGDKRVERPFGSLGDNLEEFQKVKDKVMGLKLYLNETTGNFLINTETLKKIFKTWSGNIILVHAEDDAVSEVIKNVRETKNPAHFCHISLQSDLEQIMVAKEKGLPVTCGITPHHLFLTQKDAEKLGAYGKMKPYLKSEKDVEFLWNNLDYIDVIESDHAPHTKEEKDSENPPFGVPGLETTLPLLLTAVYEKKLKMENIIRLCHDNPKKIFKIPDQDSVVEIDPDEEYEINNSDLFTKCGWTPFTGKKMYGRIKKVTLRGKNVFEDGKILAEPGSGIVIKPHAS